MYSEANPTEKCVRKSLDFKGHKTRMLMSTYATQSWADTSHRD